MTVNAINPVRGYKYIIIHHTATDNYSERDNSKYNYIILKSWDIVKGKWLDQIAWSTWNYEANRNWVQISLVGNFNNYLPTDAQINALKQLVKDIKDKVWNLIIKTHKDVWISACPGKFFEVEKYDLGQYEGKDGKTIFSLSRYYSPMPNQRKYYNGKSYEADLAMNTSWDPLVTANWHTLTKSDVWISVACDKSHLGEKLFLEWVWEVTCNDVGWAIKWHRIDMWCGIGDEALDNWDSCPTWQMVWYRIK